MSSDDEIKVTDPISFSSLATDTERVAQMPGLARYVGHVQAVWKRVHLGKVALFVASLFLFILAITLMKEGSLGLAALVRDRFAITNPTDALGFGWLFAYTIMSGSPVAATALTLFDAGVLDNLGTFAMIVGSRLGASFIVLFIGFIYVLRGRDRAASLEMGLLSLNVTATTYLPGLALGAALLHAGTFAQVQLHSGVLLTVITERVFGPIVGWITGLLPQWAVFGVGLGIIIASFSLFDRCLPTMTIKESQVGRTARLVYRRGVMFILGGLVTLVSMSVSISLSLLVPLSNRGFIRRENVIPYIMGANITTFVDTLLAAVLLNNPPAFTVVLVAMLSNALISILILLTFYPSYQRAMLKFAAWVTASNRNLAIFMAVILIIPLFLMLF
jgi:sodium-dependent phosphate cotransporter